MSPYTTPFRRRQECCRDHHGPLYGLRPPRSWLFTCCLQPPCTPRAWSHQRHVMVVGIDPTPSIPFFFYYYLLLFAMRTICWSAIRSPRGVSLLLISFGKPRRLERLERNFLFIFLSLHKFDFFVSHLTSLLVLPAASSMYAFSLY